MHPAGLTNDGADLVSVERGSACAAPPDFIARCIELDNLFAYVLVRITVHHAPIRSGSMRLLKRLRSNCRSDIKALTESRKIMHKCRHRRRSPFGFVVRVSGGAAGAAGCGGLLRMGW